MNGDFPENFLWGASTSAHQVEGNNHNQWSEWERANAGRLASTFSKRLWWLPNIDELKPIASKPANYISGRGIEHYVRYKEDFALLTELNMNAFRFSVEWSRIEPTEGQWDEAAIEHYRDYIAELYRRNITPIMTIWHWTVPVWFAKKGGFAKRANIRYFERFVQKIAKDLCEHVPYVTVLNEPNAYATYSYGTGDFPPGRRVPLLALIVYRNLLLAHRRAYYLIKAAHPKIHIGIAQSLWAIRPTNRNNVFDRLMVAFTRYGADWWFLDRARAELDFIGVNYYFTSYLTWLGIERDPPEPKSDLGWYLDPAGIERLLIEITERYHKPIIITENGLADARDEQRTWWLAQTLAAIRRALDRGVDLRGYLHWSLLDNFEWANGWWPKFGLVAVDRSTMKRTVRPSARWFAKRILQSQGSPDVSNTRLHQKLGDATDDSRL